MGALVVYVYGFHEVAMIFLPSSFFLFEGGSRGGGGGIAGL